MIVQCTNSMNHWGINMKKIIIAALLCTLTGVVSSTANASLLGNNNNKEEQKGKYHITCWHPNGSEYVNRDIKDFYSYNSLLLKIINLNDSVDYVNSECYIEKY
ncbi:hypothetical protein RaK2_00205 [Klebsiella phage vB_KleM_RaK2]|uniref:Uncharacterized protein n=2 Tax=Alcyoneusvirus TaxID=2560086 RepID=H6X412_9CAUD|nr:hypothetical protein F403_gp330 [Klebsiella phage vB_KleM_RaK2]AFA44478.1 hypothetical protein RaK2_00205 [Klebsiella phage vB_KleM_RaK2]